MARYKAYQGSRTAEAEIERWASQLRKGALAMGILLLLRDGRRYGLELVEELERATGLAISEGTIYPLLSRLHRQGLLAAEWETETSGHPRKYYRLTPKGEAHLRAMVVRWQAFSQGLNELIRREPPLPASEEGRTGEGGEAHAHRSAGEATPSRGREAASRLPEPA